MTFYFPEHYVRVKTNNLDEKEKHVFYFVAYSLEVKIALEESESPPLIPTASNGRKRYK